MKIALLPIPAEDDFTIAFPEGADILEMRVIKGAPFMLVLADPMAATVPRRFHIWAAGADVPRQLASSRQAGGSRHVGTIVLNHRPPLLIFEVPLLAEEVFGCPL